MARPKKAKTLDRRVSVRVSDETYASYQRIADAFDIPVGQLLRQVLTLEVPELEELVAALQQRATGIPYASYRGQLPHSERERLVQGAQHGGLTERLRHHAALQFRSSSAEQPAEHADSPAPTRTI